MIVPDTIPVERKVLHRGRGPARARAAPPLLAARSDVDDDVQLCTRGNYLTITQRQVDVRQACVERARGKHSVFVCDTK